MVTIKDMSWVSANNMDAGKDEAGRRSIDVSPRTVKFGGGAPLHLLIVLGPLTKKLLRDTPLLLFSQLHMGMTEKCRY